MSFLRITSATVLLALAAAGATLAQDPNACDLPGEFPDVTISDLFETRRLGSVDGITAFSLGTTSCNLGTCWLAVFASSDQHPVFAQNMYRLKGGKFEQIGQSWAAHRFIALSQPNCSAGCIFAPSTFLGVDCSTGDLAVYGASHGQLGPRFEVNPVTGDFPFPPTYSTLSGDAVFKRLQVRNADLDPALNADADYFVEGIYVAPDDAAGSNQNNNASSRTIDVSETGGELDIALTGQTQEGVPAIAQWPGNDPSVLLTIADLPDDGRFLIGSKATPLGGGRWHYEYAVENLNSHRAGLSFVAPLPPGASVTHVGFHDVDYHSGEPFDGTDWAPSVDLASNPGGVAWTTQTFAENAEANALRWGTLYNFRFDTDVSPVQGKVHLALFRPGSPDQLAVLAMVPGACDPNGTCEPDESECSCPADCGTPPEFELACNDQISNDCDGLVDCSDPDCCADAACAGLDLDGDGIPSCADCDDTEPTAWAIPGEPGDLVFAADAQTLSWSPPSNPGAAAVTHDVLRSNDPRDFIEATTCVPDDGIDTIVTDEEIPAPGAAFFYVVRAENRCPFGLGSSGSASDDQERVSLGCP